MIKLLSELLWLAAAIAFLSGCITYAVDRHAGLKLLKSAAVLVVAKTFVQICLGG